LFAPLWHRLFVRASAEITAADEFTAPKFVMHCAARSGARQLNFLAGCESRRKNGVKLFSGERNNFAKLHEEYFATRRFRCNEQILLGDK
jgi:hypothetical protein